MKKIVLTGGSHTGKTTLWGELRRIALPGMHFLEEPAALLIGRELERARTSEGYVPVLPTTHYAHFAAMAIKQPLYMEAAIPADTELAIMDRSLADNMAYARHNNRPDIGVYAAGLAGRQQYDAAFLCDFVGTYALSDTRLEDEGYAQAMHIELRKAYEELEVPVIDVPPLPIAERATYVWRALEDL